MEGFKFSLDVLLKVKNAEQKRLNYELHGMNNRLLQLMQEFEEIETEKEIKNQQIQAALTKGMDIYSLKSYGAYRETLFQASRLQRDNIETVDRQVDVLREEYIDIKKELDMLDRLKQQQFDIYLYNMAQKQAKEIEDIVSYKMVRGAEHGNA